MASNFYNVVRYPSTMTTDAAATFELSAPPATTGLTYSVKYEFTCDGTTTSGTLATGLTNTTYTFTPKTAIFAPLMTKSEEGVIKMIFETNNSHKNSVIITRVLKLKESLKPIIANQEIKRTNAYDGKSISKVTNHTLIFGIAGLYGASQTIEVTIRGSKYTKEVAAVSDDSYTPVSFDIGTFENVIDSDPDTIVVSIKITDSRSRSCTFGNSFSVYKYSPPNIVASIFRNSDEQPTLAFKSSYQATVAEKANSLKQFFARVSINGVDKDTDLKGKTSPQALEGTYSLTKSYVVYVYIQDQVISSTIVKKLVLPSTKLIMDVGADGNTVTFFGTSPSSADEETLRIGDVASFGKEVVLGKTSDKYTKIGDSGLSIYDGINNLIGQIGYGDTKNKNGEIVKDCFYTLGSREAGTTIGTFSVAAGSVVEASGHASFAEGFQTKASGLDSHAEGSNTTASGEYSHAEGSNTTASELNSHAEGASTISSGTCSHAEGYYTIASGEYSHAGGYHTIASGNYQTVVGQFNIEDKFNAENLGNKYSFIVGNGISDTERSNAFAVCDSGDVEVNGKSVNNLYAGEVFHHYANAETTLTADKKRINIPAFTSGYGSTLSKLYFKNSNLEIKINRTGLYAIIARVAFRPKTAGGRAEFAIHINGTRLAMYASSMWSPKVDTRVRLVPFILQLKEGDKITFQGQMTDNVIGYIAINDITAYALDYEGKYK
nr:MAG TPA: YadA-like protein [Caudoviricetes sp.]